MMATLISEKTIAKIASEFMLRVLEGAVLLLRREVAKPRNGL